MKVVLTSLSLAISLSFAGYAFAASPRSEPVSILPAQEIHIGKAELGKNCTLIRAYPNQGLSRVTHAIT